MLEVWCRFSVQQSLDAQQLSNIVTQGACNKTTAQRHASHHLKAFCQQLLLGSDMADTPKTHVLLTGAEARG